MAFTAVKATKIAATALGLLQRDIILPNLVWRDAVDNFAGAVNDTVNIRVPAVAKARTKALRVQGSGRQIVMDDLAEGSVPLQLTTDVYHGTSIDDEQMELDVTDFSVQILDPQTRAIAEGLEDGVAANMVATTYLHDFTFDTSYDPYDVFVDAKQALNDEHIPLTDRFCVVGSEVATWILKSDHFKRYDESGANAETAFREAQLGRLAGWNITESYAIPGDNVFWFHRTAYAFSMHAPKVPRGASFGSSQSYQGLAMRWIMDYDADFQRDRSIVNVYTGSTSITDYAITDLSRSGAKSMRRAARGTLATS
ncbi:hypothetical protein ACWEOE_10870 [Amycolatopsis sp. NPDC004368]